MKKNIILAAFITMLSFAGVSSAQSLRLTFNEAILNNSGDEPISTLGNWGEGKKVKIDFVKTSRQTTETLINFTGLEVAAGRLFEAVLPASSHEECLAYRDFSMAVPVGPERATFQYDSTNLAGSIRWFVPVSDDASCRVLVVRSSTSSGDYNVWRSRFGSSIRPSNEDAPRSDVDSIIETTPQRSRVTSISITFDGMVNF